MVFNLFKLAVTAAVVSALSATAVSVVRSEDRVSTTQSSASAEFCADPSSKGNCVFVFPGNNGECVSFAGLFPSNGLSSFAPLEAGVSCTMFTGANCNGNAWVTSVALPNFSLLAFGGISPDNAINSAICTGGF